MAEDEKGKKRPLGRAVESLGWLASSGVQPKKRKEIQGALGASPREGRSLWNHPPPARLPARPLASRLAPSRAVSHPPSRQLQA